MLLNISYLDIYLIYESQSMRPRKCLPPLMIWSMSFKQRMELKKLLVFPLCLGCREGQGLPSFPPFIPFSPPSLPSFFSFFSFL